MGGHGNQTGITTAESRHRHSAIQWYYMPAQLREAKQKKKKVGMEAGAKEATFIQTLQVSNNTKIFCPSGFPTISIMYICGYSTYHMCSYVHYSTMKDT